MKKTKEEYAGAGLTAGIILLALLSIFVTTLLYAVPVMLLWNWLIPSLFGLTKITLLEAWGLTFLSSLLFKTQVVKNE